MSRSENNTQSAQAQSAQAQSAQAQSAQAQSAQAQSAQAQSAQAQSAQAQSAQAQSAQAQSAQDSVFDAKPPAAERARMIRVDQAGEYGAIRIYAGQLAVMGDRHPLSAEIAHMAEQEEGHRAKFDALMVERGVRPTILQPFWSVAGFALGAGTALIGPEAAMACTAAVEEEIDRHYSQQLDALEEDGDDPDLADMIAEFREDERQHRDTALAAGAERAPAYPLLSGAIRLGCRVAIRLAERV